jgi:hypothetical protein
MQTQTPMIQSSPHHEHSARWLPMLLTTISIFCPIITTAAFQVPTPIIKPRQYHQTLFSSPTSTSSSTETTSSTSYAAPLPEINRRRNLAIISHPDSGKTTMTEKLLLYGGAVQTAGAVRMKGEQRATRSDFMEMEKQRGISIRCVCTVFVYCALFMLYECLYFSSFAVERKRY